MQAVTVLPRYHLSPLSVDIATGEIESLVAAALRGDGAALRELYRRGRPRVLRLAQGFATLDSADHEDVVQETFVTAFRRLKELRSPAQFEPWLLAIARSKAISLHRRRVARNPAAGEGWGGEESAAAFPEALRVERDAALVRQLIDELPEGDEKETARLFYVQGELSAKEIAERMGVGKSAITMRLERFRARIKRELLRRVLRARLE